MAMLKQSLELKQTQKLSPLQIQTIKLIVHSIAQAVKLLCHIIIQAIQLILETHQPIIYGDFFFTEAIAKLKGSKFNPWMK